MPAALSQALQFPSLPEREKVLVQALCIGAEDALWETGPWELMAKLTQKDLKEKDSSRAMRGWLQAWERLHSIQAHAHLQPRRKINCCLSTPSRKEYLDLYHRPQDFSPAPYSHSLQCHASISPSSSKLDRCDSSQHLTTQFLKPYLTSGTNMDCPLGQIHLPYYFFKVIQNSLLKSSLIKGNWNQPAKGNSLKLGM